MTMHPETAYGMLGKLPREVRDQIYCYAIPKRCHSNYHRFEGRGCSSSSCSDCNVAFRSGLGLLFTSRNIHNESVEILYAESSFCIPYKLIDTLSARTGPPLTWKNVKKMRILTISIEARMRNTNGVHAYPAPFNELDERYIVPLFDFLAKGDTAVQTLTLEMEDCTPDFLTCVIYARDLFEWLEPHVQKFVKIPELVIAFHTDAYPNERWAWIKAFDFNPPAKGFLDTHGAGTWRSMWSLQYDCLMIGLAEALRDEFGPIEAEDQSEDDWRYSRRMKFRPADHSRTELGDVVEEQ